ncbi:MAG TPA: hypothetical protein VFK40_01580 [Nitrososphaeraceae archaeon]|nr:hypothetical protein [Nitrososphaeraceae archaeon]
MVVQIVHRWCCHNDGKYSVIVPANSTIAKNIAQVVFLDTNLLFFNIYILAYILDTNQEQRFLNKCCTSLIFFKINYNKIKNFRLEIYD